MAAGCEREHLVEEQGVVRVGGSTRNHQAAAQHSSQHAPLRGPALCPGPARRGRRGRPTRLGVAGVGRAGSGETPDQSGSADAARNDAGAAQEGSTVDRRFSFGHRSGR